MFFFPFLCIDIPDLTLGVLTMLIRVCFRDALQPTVYYIAPGMIQLSANLYGRKLSIYGKFLLLQVLAIYNKVSSSTKLIMDKSVFLYWWFSFDL